MAKGYILFTLIVLTGLVSVLGLERTLYVSPDADTRPRHVVRFDRDTDNDPGSMTDFIELQHRIRREAGDVPANGAASGSGTTTSTSTAAPLVPALDEEKDQRKIIPKVKYIMRVH